VTVYIVTQAGYTATLDFAARMGTPGAQQWADRKRPGTPIPDPSPRWIADGWVEQAETPAEPDGQLTLF